MEKTLENGFNRTIENSLTVSEAQSAIQIPIIGLKPQKVVISVYIEGWDLDNTDITKLGSDVAGSISRTFDIPTLNLKWWGD